ncbi:uL15 family ribosomal protein [Candidatus Woesearchaeota archaeon]|nr:uL15 family ribosomal protein [Candidatus Woesearchaeota archaeon]
MTVNRRKKVVKLRGSKTHGWGAKKKHRGQGHRGGRGMAGTGKRADSKKPSIWKTDYFGKHGFVSKTQKLRINPVNVRFIEQHLDNLVSNGLVSKDNGFYYVELEKIGFNKLLGDGKVSTKFRIKTPYASKMAIEKVKEAGGEVIGLVEAESSG